ncbi:hypothetical protein ACF1BE_34800 [Streptomyces sp. NPDC014991]|uniref:hypothetical protein n=1 Tax=Streptomyces sp. NPDC014991 TaxID=3364935 RepID=UPI0036FF5A4F
MQRLWAQMASDGLVPREIPIDGLSRIHRALAALNGDEALDASLSDLSGQVFVEHDHLDGAMVGQADMLAQLADRFDLDLRATGELKQLILEYAIHVVVQLDAAVVRIHAELVRLRLRPRFAELAAARRRQSPAGVLLTRGDWHLRGGCGRRTGSSCWGGSRPGAARRHGSGCSWCGRFRCCMPICCGTRVWPLRRRCGRGRCHWRLPAGIPAMGGQCCTRSWHEGPRVAALAMLRASGQSSPSLPVSVGLAELG